MTAAFDVIPQFCLALVGELQAAGEPALAAQVTDLQVHSLCACGLESCAMFYATAPPAGAYGPGHRNVTVDVEDEMVILDVMDDVIVAVEILDRPDLRTLLLAQVTPSAGR